MRFRLFDQPLALPTHVYQHGHTFMFCWCAWCDDAAGAEHQKHTGQDAKEERAASWCQHVTLALDDCEGELSHQAIAETSIAPPVLLAHVEAMAGLEVLAAVASTPKKKRGLGAVVEPGSEAGRAELLALWVAGWPHVAARCHGSRSTGCKVKPSSNCQLIGGQTSILCEEAARAGGGKMASTWAGRSTVTTFSKISEVKATRCSV